MTLDSWGVLGRVLLEEKGLFGAFYITFFIFIMSYFFMNIMLGFLVDELTPNDKNEPKRRNSIEIEVNIYEKIIDVFIVIFFLMSGFEIHSNVNSNENKGKWAILYEFTIDFFYICFFFLWVFEFFIDFY